MPYRVYWEAPNAMLYLKLSGDVSLQEFIDIDREITRYLASDKLEDKVTLLVDVNEAKSVPHSFNQLKASQTYATVYDSKLSHILVVSGGNKLMRLMMMLTLNLSRPSLQFFDTPMQALSYFSQVRRSQSF